MNTLGEMKNTRVQTGNVVASYYKVAAAKMKRLLSMDWIGPKIDMFARFGIGDTNDPRISGYKIPPSNAVSWGSRKNGVNKSFPVECESIALTLCNSTG